MTGPTPLPSGLRRSALAAALLCLAGTTLAEGTRVYRCTGEDGRVEFRQGTCSTGIQQELEVENAEVGWEAPTATVEMKKRLKSKSAKRSASSSSSDQRRAEKCFKTEQRLENVNRKLRRGYKAGKGSDLRHKRRQYEEYLERLCS